MPFFFSARTHFLIVASFPWLSKVAPPCPLLYHEASKNTFWLLSVLMPSQDPPEFLVIWIFTFLCSIFWFLVGYNKEGFLAIQHAVDKAIMWHHDPNATLNMFKNLHVLLQRFPFGPHIKDPFLVILQNEFPLLLMLSFICVELIIINSILLEKEKKLKVALSTQMGSTGLWGGC